MQTNREKIYRAALRLFAEQGYEQVSLRDLADEVGIKASSIYNHFRNKGAILDAVVEDFRRELHHRRINQPWQNLDAAVKERGPEAVLREIMLAPLQLLSDASLTNLVKVVTRGQYFHAGIRSFLREELLQRPQDLLVSVLRRFEELGLAGGYTPEFLAAELQAPVTASFYRLSLRPEGQWLDPEYTRLAVAGHVAFFWQAVQRGRPQGEKR